MVTLQASEMHGIKRLAHDAELLNRQLHSDSNALPLTSSLHDVVTHLKPLRLLHENLLVSRCFLQYKMERKNNLKLDDHVGAFDITPITCPQLLGNSTNFNLCAIMVHFHVFISFDFPASPPTPPNKNLKAPSWETCPKGRP